MLQAALLGQSYWAVSTSQSAVRENVSAGCNDLCHGPRQEEGLNLTITLTPGAHQVHVQGQVRDRAQRVDDQRPDGDVGHEPPVLSSASMFI